MIGLTIPIAGQTVVVRTHHVPHIDEHSSVWAMIQFGTTQFFERYRCWDGISQCWYVPIGIEGGAFDEHAREGQAAKKDQCAFTLVCEALGVQDNPRLQVILDCVLGHDLAGKAQPKSLAQVSWAMGLQYYNEPAGVVSWMYQALEAKYNQQSQTKDFTLSGFRGLLADDWFDRAESAWKFRGEKIRQAKEELPNCHELEEIEGPAGKKLKMVTVQSGNPFMVKIVRQEMKPDIVVMAQSSGNVQVFGQNLDLTHTLVTLRCAETMARTGSISIREIANSAQDGSQGLWHGAMPDGAHNLFDGSITYPEVAPTALGLAGVQEIIRQTARYGWFLSQ